MRISPSIVWLLNVVGNWAMITVSFFLIYKTFDWPWKAVALVLIARCQHSLAVLGHDSAHYLALKDSRKWNEILGAWLCFYPVGMSLESYRSFHFDHHRFTGTEKDPEISLKKKMRGRWDLPVTPKRIVMQFVGDLAGFGIRDILVLASTFSPKKHRDRIGFWIFWLVTLLASVKLKLLGCVGVWFLTLVTIQWALFSFRVWMEHSGLGPGESHRINSNPVTKFLFFPNNTHCHWEHHEFPMIPFSQLPSVRDRTRLVKPIQTVSQVVDDLNRQGELLRRHS